jgi:hypothetical protein
MSLRPVDSAASHIVLHRNAHSRGYSLSREGADPKSLRRCASSSTCSVRCDLIAFSPLDVAPASPFIVFKGRAWVTFVVKR